ncbi:unnamed protein product [Merluccius merluccius]
MRTASDPIQPLSEGNMELSGAIATNADIPPSFRGENRIEMRSVSSAVSSGVCRGHSLQDASLYSSAMLACGVGGNLSQWRENQAACTEQHRDAQPLAPNVTGGFPELQRRSGKRVDPGR